jgi:hypothetical protein
MVEITNPSRRAQTVGPPRDGLHSASEVGRAQESGPLPAAQARAPADAFSKLVVAGPRQGIGYNWRRRLIG